MSPEQRCQQLFAVYVDEMFNHRDREFQYPKPKTMYWLACLARLLVGHNQSEFHLDRIQRDWLPAQAQQRMVAIASTLLLALLVGPLSLGLAVGLTGPESVGIGDTFAPGIVVFALSAGPSAGLFYGLGALSGSQQLAARLRWSWSAARNRLGSTLLAGLLFAGLFSGLFTLAEGPFSAPSGRVVTAVFGGLSHNPLPSSLLAGQRRKHRPCFRFHLPTVRQ